MPSLCSDWLPSVDGLASAYADGGSDAVCAAIATLAAPVLDQRLFTVNRFDAPNMRVVRLFSSNPQAYPPGGSKSKAGMPWGRHVLLNQKIFVGEGSAAIVEAFDDHAAIAALGLQSVINVPVVIANECLGTVNFLMSRTQVRAEHIRFAQMLALLTVPVFRTQPLDAQVCGPRPSSTARGD